MVASAQIILTDFGELGWGISSPDLPSLVGGSMAGPGDVAEVYEIARFGGLDPDGSIELHVQRPIVVADNVYMVRVRQDQQSTARGEVADHVCEHVRQRPELRRFTDPDALDDRLVVAALRTDRLRSVMAAVEPGSPVTIAVMSEDGAQTQYIGILGRPDTDGVSLSRLGLVDDPTIGEVQRALEGSDAKVLSPV